MKITMGCDSTHDGVTWRTTPRVRLECDITAETTEKALRELLEQAQLLAIAQGVDGIFTFTHEQIFRRIQDERAQHAEAIGEAIAKAEADTAETLRAILRTVDWLRADLRRQREAGR